MNQPENTIPFSVEKWKAGYEVVCRDGKVLSDLHYFESATTSPPLVGVMNGLVMSWNINGTYRFGSECNSDMLDLFLRPKMEKWYRRAYWIDTNLIYAIPAQGANDPGLRDNRFAVSTRKWAGPIEEFEVMAREG